MSILHLTSYFAALVAFMFITLSLASGLLYIAEVIEEHSIQAKVIGKRIIYSIITLHLLFYFFDGLPFFLTLLGIICHLVYLSNFSASWPVISLTSAKFILSCVLVIIDHFAYFYYFAEISKKSSWRGNSQRVPYRPSWEDRKMGRASAFGNRPQMMDIATFFGVCVWLVPFYLFLSLSANDNVLPSNLNNDTAVLGPKIVATAPNQEKRRPPNLNFLNGSTSQGSIFRTIITAIPLPTLRKPRTSHRELDGLIASPLLVPHSRPTSPAPLWAENHQWGDIASPATISLDEPCDPRVDVPSSPNVNPPSVYIAQKGSLTPQASLAALSRRPMFDSSSPRTGLPPSRDHLKRLQRSATSPTESSYSSTTSSTRSSGEEDTSFRIEAASKLISDHALGIVGMGGAGLAKRKV